VFRQGEIGGYSTGESFRDLMFSDLRRYLPYARPSWPALVACLFAQTGLVASLVLRSQQCLMRRGHVRLAWVLRSLGSWLTGADFVPGVEVGPGLLLSHPVGVVLGSGARLGSQVTLAGGVTLGVRDFDPRDPGRHPEYPSVGDGVFLGAHAVLAGGVHVGDHATVGANSVVVEDVPPGKVVAGSPAREVGVSR
jgi:serine O-acetyltransferase